MLKKTNIHQKIAIFYFLISLPVIEILTGGELYMATALQYRMITFIYSIPLVIIIAPIFLKIDFFNRNLNWTNELTAEQKSAVLDFKIIQYNKIPRSSDYIGRINPYVYKIGSLSLFGFALPIPDSIDNGSLLCSFFGAFSFYLFFVVIIILATIPVFTTKSRLNR